VAKEGRYAGSGKLAVLQYLPKDRDDEGMSMEPDNPITCFAQNSFCNEGIRFGIKKRDRLARMYVIGRTGTGKLILLETLIQQEFPGQSRLPDSEQG